MPPATANDTAFARETGDRARQRGRAERRRAKGRRCRHGDRAGSDPPQESRGGKPTPATAGMPPGSPGVGPGSDVPRDPPRYDGAASKSHKQGIVATFVGTGGTF